MAESNCANCNFRAKYDTAPTSFLGRLWHWHAGWCPGWRQYMESLNNEERNDIAKRYHMKKFISVDTSAS
ncbi:hypothetical protein JW960_14425 [candidate division KSB1 bacterium]|nr:hypothetical protein [candidate division KSB1 bacterium]